MDFYHWDTSEKHRKLELKIEIFETESVKMKNWTGNFKNCCKCKNSLPENSYFYASGGGQGNLHKQCKVCEGTSFGWGRNYNKEIYKKGFKYCRKCDKVLPLNVLYFNKSNGRCNNGFSSNCKQCLSNGEREYGLSRINGCDDIYDIQNNHKVCNNCLFELPNNDIFFFKKSSRKNGQTICKSCLGYSYGIERINRVLIDYIDKTHRFCASCKEKKHVNDMSDLSTCRVCKKIKTKLFNSQPEQKLRFRMNSQKRRNKAKLVSATLTNDDFRDTLEFFNYSCAYCGMSEDDHIKINNQKLHCEHVIPLDCGGSFTKENIVPSCKSCNSSKGVRSIEEFLIANNNFTEAKYQKILEYITIAREV